MADSMDQEILLYSVVFLYVWWCYGLKWAILILFTVLLVKFAANNYPSMNTLAKKRIRFDQNHYIKNVEESDRTDEAYDSGSTGRSIRTIRRQYVNPVSVKRDLIFTDLQMNRSLSPRRGTSLKSPEPLISEVTRHLSFSNASYHPNITRNNMMSVMSQHHHNSTLNITRQNNSYLLSPTKSHNTSLNDMSPLRKPCLDIGSSPLQDRYSPCCFSVLDPKLNMAESPSMVKIAQPSEAVQGSPLSFESILEKRLQRTKENPCSRQAVLSALAEKSRKRPAYEADGSFLGPTYGVKKRRHDDLDDFLHSVTDPLSTPAKVPFSVVKSVKRPYLHSDSEETHFSSLRTDKRSREGQSSSEDEILGSADRIKLRNNEEVKETENTLNNLSNYDCGNTGDSGVVLSISDDIGSVGQAKTKKAKTVTFSQEVAGNDSSNIPDNPRTASYEVHSNLNEKPRAVENGERNSAELLSVFQGRFSPRKPLHNTSPITKAKEKKGRRRSHLTWKDLQKNRREAWRRSQKLLDDIEESIARDKGEPSGSLVNQAVSSNTDLTNGILKTGVSSINDNAEKVPISILFGSTQSQALPSTSISIPSSLFSSTNTSSTLTSTANSLLKTTQPIEEKDGKQTLPSATIVLSSQSQATNFLPNSSASTTLNSASAFGNNQSGINFGVANGITGTSGTSSVKLGTVDFKFAVPKSPVKKTTTVTTATNLTKPFVGDVFASSSSAFPGFGTSTRAVQQPTTDTTTLGLKTIPLAPTAVPQTTSAQFGFLGNPLSTTSQSKTNLSTFTFQTTSSSSGSSSNTLPQTTTTVPNPGGFAFGSNTQITAPILSSQSKPADLFSFNAGSGIGFAGVSQSSSAPGFGVTSQNGPAFGSQGAAATAGQAKTGGFTFTAPAVNKPSPAGGFNFGQNQAAAGAFNFGSPAPAAQGGFTFGMASAGIGTPFASSTPMPGISGGVVGGAFALGSAGTATPGVTTSKARTRRRTRK